MKAKQLREIIKDTVWTANHGYCETSHNCDEFMEELINDTCDAIESSICDQDHTSQVLDTVIEEIEGMKEDLSPERLDKESLGEMNRLEGYNQALDAAIQKILEMKGGE